MLAHHCRFCQRGLRRLCANDVCAHRPRSGHQPGPDLNTPAARPKPIGTCLPYWLLYAVSGPFRKNEQCRNCCTFPFGRWAHISASFISGSIRTCHFDPLQYAGRSAKVCGCRAACAAYLPQFDATIRRCSIVKCTATTAKRDDPAQHNYDVFYVGMPTFKFGICSLSFDLNQVFSSYVLSLDTLKLRFQLGAGTSKVPRLQPFFSIHHTPKAKVVLQ